MRLPPLMMIHVLAVLVIAGCIQPAIVPPASTEALAPPQAHAHKDPEAEEAPSRYAHVRLWNETGALRFSTWPGETGDLHAEPEAANATGPFRWIASPDGNRGREPLWEPLLPMLHHAPPNATVRLVDYTLLEHRLEQVVLEKHLSLPVENEMPRDAAEAIFTNITPGATVYFLGKIPVYIVDADGASVTYRFAMNDTQHYEVQRSVGLWMHATHDPEKDLIQFSLVVPDGDFVAHNNCALPQKIIDYGYYVLREETPEHLVLDRYNNRIEYLLEHQTVSLEVSFLDGHTPHEDEHTHD